MSQEETQTATGCISGTTRQCAATTAAVAPDPQFVFFQKVDLAPGSYLVEVYAFLSSLTVNFAWEDGFEHSDDLRGWWTRTRGDEPTPEWIRFFAEEDYVDGEEYGFLEYLIRLAPLTGEVAPPPLDEETSWYGVFEVRTPPSCPKGVLRSKYGEIP